MCDIRFCGSCRIIQRLSCGGQQWQRKEAEDVDDIIDSELDRINVKTSCSYTESRMCLLAWMCNNGSHRDDNDDSDDDQENYQEADTYQNRVFLFLLLNHRGAQMHLYQDVSFEDLVGFSTGAEADTCHTESENGCEAKPIVANVFVEEFSDTGVSYSAIRTESS